MTTNITEIEDAGAIFAQSLNEEDKRGVSESLTEEELAILDILTRPNLKLSRMEKETVKEVAKDLLNTLKTEKLVLDWRKRQQTRAAVQVTIEQPLESLPLPMMMVCIMAWFISIFLTLIMGRIKAFILC